MFKNARDLKDDTRGATAVLGTALGVMMVGALWHIASVGDAIAWRERVQDVADSAAFENAVWHARGMNTLAVMNILMASVLSVLVIWRVAMLLFGIALAILMVICAVMILFGATTGAYPCVQSISVASTLAAMAARDTAVATNVLRVMTALQLGNIVISTATPIVATATAMANTRNHYKVGQVYSEAMTFLPSFPTKMWTSMKLCFTGMKEGKMPPKPEKTPITTFMEDYIWLERVGFGVSLPVALNDFGTMCLHAGTSVFANLKTLLKLAGVPGSALSGIDKAGEVFGHITGNLPAIFCSPIGYSAESADKVRDDERNARRGGSGGTSSSSGGASSGGASSGGGSGGMPSYQSENARRECETAVGTSGPPPTRPPPDPPGSSRGGTGGDNPPPDRPPPPPPGSSSGGTSSGGTGGEIVEDPPDGSTPPPTRPPPEVPGGGGTSGSLVDEGDALFLAGDNTFVKKGLFMRECREKRSKDSSTRSETDAELDAACEAEAKLKELKPENQQIWQDFQNKVTGRRPGAERDEQVAACEQATRVGYFAAFKKWLGDKLTLGDGHRIPPKWQLPGTPDKDVYDLNKCAGGVKVWSATYNGLLFQRTFSQVHMDKRRVPFNDKFLELASLDRPTNIPEIDTGEILGQAEFYFDCDKGFADCSPLWHTRWTARLRRVHSFEKLMGGIIEPVMNAVIAKGVFEFLSDKLDTKVVDNLGIPKILIPRVKNTAGFRQAKDEFQFQLLDAINPAGNLGEWMTARESGDATVH